jgi:hypothetical protein
VKAGVLPPVLAALALVACVAPSAKPAADPTIALTLANSGAVPLRCKVIYGHWTERDLGVLAPGATTGFDLQQQTSDGALYVERSDGQRRMMIENLFCGAPGAWQATMGQVNFAPARAARPREIAAACGAPASGARVSCAPLRLRP